jgi:Sulfotransferase family
LRPVSTVEELHAAASEVTGLTDFGLDDYTDGLAVLISSHERDADLTPRGQKVARAMLRGALTARLFSEAAWQAHPEYAQVPIDRPLFVTGLPRTGTTALHRLLTADPAHQGLQLWLAEVPQPRPPRARRNRSTRTSACRSAARRRMPCGLSPGSVGPGQRTVTRSPTSA